MPIIKDAMDSQSLVARAQQEWERLEPVMRRLYPRFPDCCCTGACILLEEALPELILVEGEYDDGHVEKDGLVSGPCGHTWLRTIDGTIIDPTLGQFIDDDAAPFRVVAKDSIHYAYYLNRGQSHEDGFYHERVRIELRTLLAALSDDDFKKRISKSSQSAE